jgi:hypothetical protein
VILTRHSFIGKINNLNDCYMAKEKELKKEDIYPVLAEYYKSIGRTNPPPYEQYSLQELKKCLVMFKINLKYV